MPALLVKLLERIEHPLSGQRTTVFILTLKRCATGRRSLRASLSAQRRFTSDAQLTRVVISCIKLQVTMKPTPGPTFDSVCKFSTCKVKCAV